MAILAACGVDHGNPRVLGEAENTSTSRRLSGGVSVGAPLLHGTVSIKDADSPTSSIPVPVNDDGTYSITLVNYMTGPYLLQATGISGGRSVCLYSVATRDDLGGTVNITPLTDLVVRNLLSESNDTAVDPSEFFETFKPSKIKSIVIKERVETHERAVRSRLVNLYDDLDIHPDTNLLTSALTTVHKGVDGLMDVVRIDQGYDSQGSLVSVATIKNQITGDEVYDDVTDPDDSDALPSMNQLPEVTSAVLEIDYLLQSFAGVFSESLPDTESIQLDRMIHGDFKTDGLDRATFIERLTSDTSLIGMSLFGMALESFDPESGSAVISFEGMKHNGFVESFYDWKVQKIDTSWQLCGNGQEIGIRIGGYVTRNQGDIAITENGIYVFCEAPHTMTEIAFVEMSGIDITESTNRRLAIDETLLPRRVFRKTIESEMPGILRFGIELPQKPLPDNTEMEFSIYDATETCLNPKPYRRVLKRGILSNETLNTQVDRFFPELIRPSQSTINAIDAPCILDSEWILPGGRIATGLRVVYGGSDQKTSVWVMLESDALSGSIEVGDGELSTVLLTLKSLDRYGWYTSTSISKRVNTSVSKYPDLTFEPESFF